MNFFKQKTKNVPQRRRAGEMVGSSNLRVEPENYPRQVFRRNATLTGSVSSDVDSVSVKHANMKSVRVEGHDLKKQRKKLSYMLLATVLMAIGVGSLLYQITAVPVLTSNASMGVDYSVYVDKIQSYLNGSPAQRLRPLIDSKAIAEYLQDNGTPEVESLSPETSFAGLGRSNMRITFRQPVVSWKVKTDTYYVDKAGISFTRNYFSEPAVQVLDNSGVPVDGNQVFASNRLIGFLGLIVGKLGARGIVVRQVELPAGTTRQVNLFIQGRDGYIKTSIDRPVGEQAEDIYNAFIYFDKKGINPEYVDVRIKGRAYYK